MIANSLGVGRAGICRAARRPASTSRAVRCAECFQRVGFCPCPPGVRGRGLVVGVQAGWGWGLQRAPAVPVQV